MDQNAPQDEFPISKHPPESPSPVVLVTGLSGAGKSSALHALEDLGYEAIDNAPASLLSAIVQPPGDMAGMRRAPLAIGVDSRTRGFDQGLEDPIQALKRNPGLDVRVLFLDCEDAVLARRFAETRRRHPLARSGPVSEGIALERAALASLRQRAGLILDTTALRPGELREILAGHFALEMGSDLAISVVSFSYREGLPREADLVFDMRFLSNPHYVDALRPKTGCDPEVGAYIEQDPNFAPALDSMVGLLRLLIPAYKREGKSYLTIATGCTGGKHRSVFVAERIAAVLRGDGLAPRLRHRDLHAMAAG